MPSQPAFAAHRRSLCLALVAGLAVGVGAASAVVVDTSVANAATAVSTASPEAQAVPQLTLHDSNGRPVYSGEADAYPTFGTAISTSGASCPADADDAARLSVTTATTSVVVSANAPVSAGQPVTVPMASSFAEVVPDVQASSADLVLECLALQAGVPATVTAVATLPVTFTDGIWSVPGAPVVIPDPKPSTSPSSQPSSPGGTDTGGTGGSGASGSAQNSATANAGGPLAFTGVEIAGLSALAAGLLAAGAFLVLRRRRKRVTVEGA